jgi:glycolate oxidase iron-sulfur subunit
MTSPVTAPAPPFASWFDPEDPPGKRDIDTCIHCGLCLTACPTYRELKIEPDSPRGRIYLMRGLAEGRIAPSDPLVGHLDLCLDCRACETVCPAGVPYGRMLEAARGQIQRRAVRRSPLRVLGDWALRSLMPHRERLHLAADLLRLGQSGPIRALLDSRVGKAALPDFARRGLAMTPRLQPRARRALEALAPRLPRGARMEDREDGLWFLPAGTPHARIAFFTTCVMEVMFPEVNREAVRLMVLAGLAVRAPRHQTCCGALQAHAGLRRTAKGLARRNVTAFGGDDDFVVTTSAGCGAALREAGHLLEDEGAATAADRFASRVRDVSEVLAQFPLPATESSTWMERVPRWRPVSDDDRDVSSVTARRRLRVGYHDPCHLAHAQRVRAAPRALLARAPGIELVELPNSDWCCGSAGVYNLTHPEMAEAQLAHKLDSIVQAHPDVVVASNPGCLLHMTRGARERGIDVPIVHLIEVLGRAYPPRAESTRPEHA